MSISGLHVTMFAWLAGLAIAALWRRSTSAMLLLPAPSAARWGGLAAATAYAFFSGWGVPSQRTIWMLATVTLLQGAGVRWPWLLVLLTSAVVVTAFDPLALTQAGFWLSFMAVGLLMASSPVTLAADPAPAIPGWRGWAARAYAHVRADLRTQVIATLGLTPLTLVFFQQVSLVGFLANLVAIPAVTLLITPLALLGTLLTPLGWLGGAVVQGLDGVLERLAAIPGAVWVVPVAPIWAQLAGLVAAALSSCPCRGGRVCSRLRSRLACCCRRAIFPPKAPSTSSPPMSGRARPCWCARAATSSSSTPGRSIRARATPASASWFRSCARAATSTSTC
jgi:competence protein ComEC